MTEVSLLKRCYLSLEDGAEELTISVTVFDEQSIQFELKTIRIVSEEPLEIEKDEWDTQCMPTEIGVKLRDFLNYAYPLKAKELNSQVGQ